MQTVRDSISVHLSILEVFGCIMRFKLPLNSHTQRIFSSFLLFLLIFPDSVNFSHHSAIEPKIIHARQKRAIENTLEKVRNSF